MKTAWWILLAVGVTAIVAGGVYAVRLADQAGVAAAAMAKVTCSCVFVDGRTLQACRADDPPGFEQVVVDIDENAKVAVGGLLGGMVTRRATYSEAYGCTLEP
jgi:hypothetical protein